MNWFKQEWRAIVAMMGRRIGPKKRPFGEVMAYGVLLGLAMVWIVVRWDFVSRFW